MIEGLAKQDRFGPPPLWLSLPHRAGKLRQVPGACSMIYEDALAIRSSPKSLMTTWGPEGRLGLAITTARPARHWSASVIWYDRTLQGRPRADGHPPVMEEPAVELLSSSKCPSEVNAADEQPYMLCGHLDRVVEFNGGTYVMDRKTTTSTIGSSWFDQFDPGQSNVPFTPSPPKSSTGPRLKGSSSMASRCAVGFSYVSLAASPTAPRPNSRNGSTTPT